VGANAKRLLVGHGALGGQTPREQRVIRARLPDRPQQRRPMDGSSLAGRACLGLAMIAQCCTSDATSTTYAVTVEQLLTSQQALEAPGPVIGSATGGRRSLRGMDTAPIVRIT
jgi:hypothetical protein